MMYDVVKTSEWMMVICQCGGVFQGDRAAYEAWTRDHVCPPPVERKTFWMSFCDPQRPTGEQFLGACVMDVSADEASGVLLEMAMRFPFHTPGAEWEAAATRKAHRLGCNPGGEIAFADLPVDHPKLAEYPRGALLSKADIERIDGMPPLLTFQDDDDEDT
jgi:hypothetical protein